MDRCMDGIGMDGYHRSVLISLMYNIVAYKVSFSWSCGKGCWWQTLISFENRTSSVWWLITASFERVAKLARESTAFKNVEKFQLSTFRQKIQPSQYFKTRTNVAMKNIFRLEPSVCISFQRAAPPWHGDESGAETIFCKNHKRIQPPPIFQTYT